MASAITARGAALTRILLRAPRAPVCQDLHDGFDYNGRSQRISMNNPCVNRPDLVHQPLARAVDELSLVERT
jgi:hypothetical protein